MNPDLIRRSIEEEPHMAHERKPFINYSLENEPILTRKKEDATFEKKEVVEIDLAQIEFWPVIRIALLLFSVVGLVVGILAFLVFPPTTSIGLSVGTRLLSALLFTVLYTLIITAGLGLIVWLYNLTSRSLKWRLRFHTSLRSYKN